MFGAVNLSFKNSTKRGSCFTARRMLARFVFDINHTLLFVHSAKTSPCFTGVIEVWYLFAACRMLARLNCNTNHALLFVFSAKYPLCCASDVEVWSLFAACRMLARFVFDIN